MSRPNTSAGALKAIIESAGLRLAAYRDQLPADVKMPVVTIDEEIGSTSELHGDPTDPNGHHGESELINVHLWQPLRNQNGRPGETFALPRQLTHVLKTTQPFMYGPDDAPTRVYGLRVDGRARIIEGTAPDEVVHTVLTITMRRDA